MTYTCIRRGKSKTETGLCTIIFIKVLFSVPWNLLRLQRNHLLPIWQSTWKLMFVCLYNLEGPAVHVYFLDIALLVGGVYHRSSEGNALLFWIKKDMCLLPYNLMCLLPYRLECLGMGIVAAWSDYGERRNLQKFEQLLPSRSTDC